MKKSFKVLIVVMFLVYSLTLAACDFNVLLDKLPFDIPFLEQKEEYTITYYVDDEVYFEINIEDGKSIKLPSDPYKDGYEFKGWVTGSGEEVYDGLIVDGNLSLYANFREINVSEEWIHVYFYVDDNLYEEQKITKGTNIKYYNVPFKDGYEFDYWMYKDGNRFYNLDDLYEDTYLYAIFKQVDNKEECVIVNFYVDGKLEKTQDFGINKYFENIFTPYKEGHTFSHWEDKYGNKYDVNTILKSNVDLYAVFIKNDDNVTCEVTYFVDALIYEKQVYSKNQTLKLPIEPYKNGYNFVGWYAGSMQYCEGDKVSGSVSLYARFEEISRVEYYIVEHLYGPLKSEYKLTYNSDNTYSIILHLDKDFQFLISQSNFSFHYNETYLNIKEGVVGFAPNIRTTVSGTFKIEIKDAMVNVYLLEEDNNIEEYTEGLDFKFYSDRNSYEVSGYRGTSKDVIIPSTYNGYPVTSLGYYLFQTEINSVFIPHTINNISCWAFSGNRVSYIVVDENNTYYDSRNNCNAIIETATGRMVAASYNTIVPIDVTEFDTSVFSMPNLKEVKYEGTQEQWNNILKNSYNDSLSSATIIYNYGSENGSNNDLYLVNTTVQYQFVESHRFVETDGKYILDITLPKGYQFLILNKLGNKIYSEINIKSSEFVKTIAGGIIIDKSGKFRFEIIDNDLYISYLDVEKLEKAGVYVIFDTKRKDLYDEYKFKMNLDGTYVLDTHFYSNKNFYLYDTEAEKTYSMNDVIYSEGLQNNTEYISIKVSGTYRIEFKDEKVTIKCIKVDNEFNIKEYDTYIEIADYAGLDKDVLYIPEQINGKPVEVVASYAFSGYKFKEIYFPSTIKYMNQSVFQGCYDLKKISITLLNKSGGYYYLHELLSAYPSERGNFYFDEVIVSVPTLTGNLFEGCNIKRITVNNAGMVMTDAFKGINNLEEIVLTTGAAYIYLDAFNGVENANIYFEKNSLANYDYNISSTNKVYLYSETEPTTSGNYWHYVDGEIVVWGEKLCTITYIVDGNVYLVEQKNIGDYLNCPINVEKTGYEFKGWYDENDRYYYAGDYVVSNYTLYAKFEPVVSPGVYLADISSNPLYEYEFKYENGIYSLDTYLNSGMAFVIYDSVNDRYIGEYDFVASEGLDRWTSCVCTNVSGNFRIELRNGKVYVSTPESNERKNYRYTEYEDYIVIDECLYTEYYLTIPSYINMKPVTIIGSYAFSGKDISYLTIPNTVVEIKEYAFSGCSNITNLYLSENLEIIGEYAFNGLGSLTRLNLNSKLIEIRSCAFSGCTSLKSLVIPKSVTYVDQSIVGAGTITLYFEHEDYSDVFDKPGYIEAYSYRASKPTTEGNYWYLYNDYAPVIWNINASGYYVIYDNIPECKEQNKLSLNSDGSYSINIYMVSNSFFTVYNVENSYFFHSGNVASYEGIYFGTSGIHPSYSGNYQIKLINDQMYIYYLG